ncbi:MAG: hypothetical protein ABI670_06285 [Chloroflexota bacterium]
MCTVLVGEEYGGKAGYKFVRCCMKVPWLGAVNIPWHPDLGWRGAHIDKNGVAVLLQDDISRVIEFSMSFVLPQGTPDDKVNLLAMGSGTRPCLYPDARGVTFYWSPGKGCLSANWLLRHSRAEGWRPDPQPTAVFASYAYCPGVE